MTTMANMMSRIDELTDEIEVLRDRFNVSEYPERNDLRMELSERMVERMQLRELYDGQFVAAAEITRLKNEIEKLHAYINDVSKQQSDCIVKRNQYILDFHNTLDKLDEQRDLVDKQAVDSVALDKIISVVRNWNRDMRSNTLVRMRQIVKIIEERDD